jgi:hypothetical protein
LPSFPFTPGALVLTGGEFNPEPVRFTFTPGLLRLSGGTFNIGPTLSNGLAALLAAVLDTLSAGEAIVDQQGRPTRRFQQIWQNAMDAIKDAFTAQGGSITELQAIYAGINAAQATGATAIQTANDTRAEINLTTSYTDPVGVGTASSAGTVTIAAHDRVYGDETSVSVNAGSVSGFASRAYVTVYYTDPAREGGAVAYSGTTGAVSQTGDTHIVWQGSIPAVGEADSSGTGPTAPGYTPPDPNTYDPRGIVYEQPFG